MEVVGGVVLVAALAFGLEWFRGTTRRRFVDAWAEERGIDLLECRHRPFRASPNWLSAYDVRWREGPHEYEERVLATGLLRRRAWLDESGSGRGLTG